MSSIALEESPVDQKISLSEKAAKLRDLHLRAYLRFEEMQNRPKRENREKLAPQLALLAYDGLVAFLALQLLKNGVKPPIDNLPGKEN